MAFTPITVTGRWTQPGADLPSRGTVAFRLYEPLTDQDTLQVSSGTTSAVLDATGAISVVLNASNDPTSRPVNVPYLVTENIDNEQRRYYVTIPHDAAEGTVDLAALVPWEGPFPGFDVARIPPTPIGATNGYVVTVEDDVYVLRPPVSGGYTGPIIMDLTGATPDGDGNVPVDLSAMDAGVTTVTIDLPTWPTPVVALLSPPPLGRGSFGVLAGSLAGETVVSIAVTSGLGTFPVTPPSIGAVSVILYPLLLNPLGSLWLPLPPPVGDPELVLVPAAIQGARRDGITGDVTVNGDQLQPALAFDDGAVSNITYTNVNAGSQARVELLIYNGLDGSGGTIAISLNGNAWPRASDIPAGSARLFRLAVSQSNAGEFTVVADQGTTIPPDSPDY